MLYTFRTENSLWMQKPWVQRVDCAQDRGPLLQRESRLERTTVQEGERWDGTCLPARRHLGEPAVAQGWGRLAVETPRSGIHS